MDKVYKKIITEVRTYFEVNNFQKAVVGISGGIDSALAAKLVADAIGRTRVFGLIMPEKGITSERNTSDAIELCRKLKIRQWVIEINPFLNQYEKLGWKQSKIALINTKARVRATILYNFANTHNALVAGTSNKSEILLGYGTKYGDLACDILVIGDLFKTDVMKLAEHLKLPESILRKAPSAELYVGQTDRDELGAPYRTLDGILRLIIEGKDYYEILRRYDKRVVRSVFDRIKDTEHKRKQTPAVKAS